MKLRSSPLPDPLALGIDLAERGYLPDCFVRQAIRRLCRTRLKTSLNGRAEEFLASLREGPIAPVPLAANSQHYQLPPELFGAMLGPQRKYSCCLWRNDNSTLADAEEAALAETANHAELADGQDILELGCGWGALSLWMAERFPASRITAVSNAASQREYIESLAAKRRICNLQVLTADMNDFAPATTLSPDRRFDRIVSVEMFEHMRNYEQLLARIATWLRPEGKLFVHLFCHRELAYPFEADGDANWMGRYFFTGGMMPSATLLRTFDRHLRVAKEWQWNGQNYSRTAEAWLANLDRRRDEVLPILSQIYGPAHARCWLQRWRMFLLAVAELFSFGAGREWFVSHYLLESTADRRQPIHSFADESVY